MRHAALLTIILVCIFLGWRLSSPEQRASAKAITRRYVIPVLIIIAVVAVLYAIFVTNSTIQIL